MLETPTEDKQLKTMSNINNHIESNKTLLNDPTISPQARRHLTDELDDLEYYQEMHPENIEDPSALELFCCKNPDAEECRIYDV